MKLSRYITAPPATEAVLAREWEAIDRRSRPRAHPVLRRTAAFAVPLAFAAAVAVVVVTRGNVESPLQGAVFGSDTGQAVVALADGSHIEVEPRARLAVVRGEPHAVRLQLQRGSASFKVAHVADRTFEVQALGIDVRVMGTRFRIDMVASERVHIAVDHGSVELVRHGSGEVLRRLNAGEEIVMEADGRRLEPPELPSLSAAMSAPPAPPPTPTIAATPLASVAAPEPRADTSRTDAHHLFDSAKAARRAGKHAVAASLFDTLRRRHPSDPRAGLSAFELGRLRMDALGDPAGALEPLAQAIALSPAGSFREDAQARLVYASDAMHDAARCKKMQQAYLKRYPRGVHAVTVASKCGD